MRPSPLGSILERTRVEKGLSRNKAAAELGTSINTYRSWVMGQKPDYSWLRALSAWTGAPIEVILQSLIDDDEDWSEDMGGYLSSAAA